MEEESDDRLNTLRIQQRSTLRRALYRSRSHAILAGALCIVAAAELARESVYFIRTRALGWLSIFVVLFVLAIFGVSLALRRAIALNRECHERVEESPSVEPDFSTLSDGSQQWRNLHDVD